MDAESLKSLAGLALWGGLFYFMMRYGCGAHMRGAHKHGARSDAAPDGAVKDPVCGMSVDPEHAAAAAVRGGRTYYFCSASCRDKFERAPEQYIGAATRGESRHKGHCHG